MVAQEQIAEDSGEIRKKAMSRLVVAGVVTVVALGALWWLDNSGNKSQSSASKPPAAIVSAQSPVIAQPKAADEPPPPVVPNAETPATSRIAEPSQPETQPPAPTAQAPVKKPTPQGTGTGLAKVASVSTEHTAQPAPVSVKPSVATNVAPPKPPVAQAFVVQLGVFADPANAKDMVDRLVKLGVRAQMETRVQVGPFQNRQAAEKARVEIERLGIKGVVAGK